MSRWTEDDFYDPYDDDGEGESDEELTPPPKKRPEVPLPCYPLNWDHLSSFRL